MSVSHSTSSDWAGSTFSLADNASGRMHANVIYPYSTNAVFNLFIDFKEPILKSNLTGNALLWLDFVYDKLKVTNRGAAAYLVFNGNTNAMAGNKTLFLGTDADSGSGRISFNFADMNTTAAALTYISQIRLVLYAEIVTSNKTDGYIDVSFGAGDIYLFNKWIYLKNDYIQV